MSDCSSPASSHRSSCTNFSSGPQSPDTTFTTPPASRESSPKFSGPFESLNEQAMHQTELYAQLGSPSSPGCTEFQVAPVPSSRPSSRPSPPQLLTNFDEPMFFSPEVSAYDQTAFLYEAQPPTMDSFQCPPYPSASEFYGISPVQSPDSFTTRWSPDTPASSQWEYSGHSEEVDPFKYQIEEWYTADGRRVEYSAMALGCATM
ncbi:hypothetical protein EX30DRAFT_367616 [Ascodesmis nigricans]|uniref:Uncharacterized protein n=1 Tax=Ascodesmis nigricans TaxID=341454 RepID=A0A4V3SJL3_9PEZI|nr:hypothetical protein EX30DRAFT_367616 [Ascodesmis nigricans]